MATAVQHCEILLASWQSVPHKTSLLTAKPTPVAMPWYPMGHLREMYTASEAQLSPLGLVREINGMALLPAEFIKS